MAENDKSAPKAEGAQATPLPAYTEPNMKNPQSLDQHEYHEVAPGVQGRVSTESEKLERAQQLNADS